MYFNVALGLFQDAEAFVTTLQQVLRISFVTQATVKYRTDVTEGIFPLNDTVSVY